MKNGMLAPIGEPRGFIIVVPDDYVHRKQIDTFFLEHYMGADVDVDAGIYNFDPSITDENFEDASCRLVPGKSYWVEIYPVLDFTSSPQCMAQLELNQVVYVSAQGLTLLYDLEPSQFGVGRSLISFDRRNALWENKEGDVFASCIQVDANAERNGVNVSVELFDLDSIITPQHEILCVRELD